MRGPFSTPITPLPGSFFHADPQARTYPSEDAARRAASAEQGRAAREPRTLDLGLALGRLEIYPDRLVTVAAFKAEIEAVKWLVADVSHELIADRGFTTALTLESAA